METKGEAAREGPDRPNVQVGTQRLRLGGRLKIMQDSTRHLHDTEELRKRLSSEGYIRLRGFFDKESIAAGRLTVISHMQEGWKIVDTSKPMAEARIEGQSKGLLLTGFRDVTHNVKVLHVLQGTRLAQLFCRLFGEPPATFDNKWVRVFGNGEFTDEHTDFYRFSSNAHRMFTAWIPFGDYTIHQGTLAVCEHSHLFPSYRSEDFAERKVELPPDFNRVKDQVTWLTADFQAGDLVIFDIRLIHCSTANTSRNFRISMDTRWQPARLVPVQNRKMFHIFQESVLRADAPLGVSLKNVLFCSSECEKQTRAASSFK
eukprot:g14594.t1